MYISYKRVSHPLHEAYDEMMKKFDLFLACESLSQAEGILDRDLNYAVFGPDSKGIRGNPDIILTRKKNEIIDCKKEIFHDGDNIFRVIVQGKDDEVKYFPVKGKNGTVNELRYCLRENENVEIWLSLLSNGLKHIDAHYTGWEKHEIYEEEYIIQQTFMGQKIACLFFTDQEEVDVYRITTGNNNTILQMTFGLKPIGFDEIARVFETNSRGCLSADLEVQGHTCKYFLVPEVTSKIDSFRQMALMENDTPSFELTTSTTNRMKVYILCPVQCTVALWDKGGNRMSSCEAPANTCMLVGTTHVLGHDVFDMEKNEYHISILGADFPLFVCMGTHTAVSRARDGEHSMQIEQSHLQFLLHKVLRM